MIPLIVMVIVTPIAELYYLQLILKMSVNIIAVWTVW